MGGEIYATIVGEQVPCILKSDEAPRYHSLFESSLNLMIGDKLLHIGCSTSQVMPFGIQLSLSDFRSIRSLYGVADLTLNDGYLVLGPVTLIYDRVSSQNTYDQSFSIDEIKNSLLVFTPFLRNTGLDFSTLDILNKENKIDLYSMIGRGSGLTPSGDDFIVGMLAVHQCYAIFSPEELSVIDKAIRKKRTTDVSIAYLSSAREGFFTSTICLLLSNMDDQSLVTMYLTELSTFGHTSGHDTISGIYYGLKHFLMRGVD